MPPSWTPPSHSLHGIQVLTHQPRGDLESWPFINSIGACCIYSSAQGPSWNNDIITNAFDTWALFLDFLVWVELTVFKETKNWRGWVGLSAGEEEGLTQIVDRFRGRWQAIWLCQADENFKKKSEIGWKQLAVLLVASYNVRNLYLLCRVSQCRHSDILEWGAVRCIVGCLAVSLASPCQMPVSMCLLTISPAVAPKMSPDVACCHLSSRDSD